MERDVSFVTGRRVRHALERLGHEVYPLDIESSTTETLIELSLDAVFISLHGPGGEDGTIQALLETLNIPYTGSGPLSSIRCMDKDYAKRALRAAGIQTPAFRTFLRRAVNDMGAAAALGVAADTLGYPLVVKPAREGSGFGLSRVEEPDGLLDALYEAFGYDAKILLERWVEGTEVSVPILEPAGEEPKVLGLVEIRPRDGAYNFEAKYTPGATNFAIPPEIPAEAAARIENTALTAYEDVGLHRLRPRRHNPRRRRATGTRRKDYPRLHRDLHLPPRRRGGRHRLRRPGRDDTGLGPLYRGDSEALASLAIRLVP